MTAETSNARGEWVLERLRGVLEHGKMGDKCLIAPDLVTAAIAALSAPPPAAARGDVPYDRELIARMLDVCGHPMFTLDAYREQARLLREAAQAKPDARGVADVGSRSVTRQLLHWGGIPVRVTGTVTTSPGNWPLIDTALTEARNG